MRKKAILLVFSVTVLFFVYSEAQNATGKKGLFAAGKWQIEIQGGWSAVSPRCLNMFAQYYQKTTSFLTLDSYKYEQQKFGNKYSYSLSLDAKNAFRELKNAFPLGITLRYHVSRRFDFSFGLSYVSGKAQSFYHASIDTKTVPPDSYGTWGLDDVDVRDLTYDDTSTSVQSWIPSVGVHYRMLQSSIFNTELFAAAGPIFASFEHTYHEFDKYTFPDGFWFAWEDRGLYTGKGVGIALFCGGRLGWKLSSRFELFTTAGYALLSVPKVTGSMEMNSRFLDVEAKPPQFTRRESTGTWYYYPAYYGRDWGYLIIDRPMTADVPPSQYFENFEINLSGFRLQAGIAFKL